MRPVPLPALAAVGAVGRRPERPDAEPSKADAEKNDPTVERVQRRAERLGFGGLIVTNLFALRSTDPRGLRRTVDPVGPDNDAAILLAARTAQYTLCAWGNHGTHLGRAALVRRMLRNDCHERRLHVLNMTGAGETGHPLYVGYDVPMVLLYPEIAAR